MSVQEMERQQPHCSRCGDIAVQDTYAEGSYNCPSCGCVGMIHPLWYSQNELDIHDAGQCHRESEPCAICGKSVQDMTRGE